MSEETEYRIWPDGTVQDCSELPYELMSDDYFVFLALNEDDALRKAKTLR